MNKFVIWLLISMVLVVVLAFGVGYYVGHGSEIYHCIDSYENYMEDHCVCDDLTKPMTDDYFKEFIQERNKSIGGTT